jgi:hypothetical protein
MAAVVARGLVAEPQLGGGFRIDVTQGSTTGSWSLGVAGCTLTTVSLTHRIAG